jgi:hypothetical protein
METERVQALPELTREELELLASYRAPGMTVAEAGEWMRGFERLVDARGPSGQFYLIRQLAEALLRVGASENQLIDEWLVEGDQAATGQGA